MSAGVRPLVLLAGAVLLLVGCEGHEFHPPDREAQVSEADSIYSSALFDTVAWDSAAARARQGNAVYAATCRRCHGTLGRGETEYARQQEVEVPSLVRADWEYRTVDQVRRRIFTGHSEGMPTFGIARLEPREIDAVSYYILEVLRPDAAAAGDGGTPGGP